MLALVLLALGVCTCNVQAISKVVTVNTEYGPVSGQEITLEGEGGAKVNTWYGIPFAKPPLGDLRWRKPEPPEPWDEPRPANVLNAACPQGEKGLIWLSHPLWRNYDEDCLYLNVFAPQNITEAKYPVMLWFHGGAYHVSANVQYPGHFLALRDVVVVVPNYRLGALGFLSTEDDEAPGNWGLHDQIMSMKWVHNNIHNFGGDKDRVTLFGQSAGASSSSLHLVIDQSWPYFNQVIPLSGSELAFWALLVPAQEPLNYTRQVAQKVGCLYDNTTLMMDCMRELPFQTIRQNQGIKCKPGYYCLGHAPVVDGDLFKKTPLELRQEGHFKNVSMMAGLLTTDGSLYTIELIPEALDGGFNRSEFETILRRLTTIFSPQIKENQTVEDVYRSLLWYYAPHPFLEDEELNRQAFNEMVTDVGFGYHSEMSCRYHAEAGNDVYYYRYGYLSEKAYEIVPPWMGVFHSAELPYVWQWPLMMDNNAAAYDSGMMWDIIAWNDLDRQFSNYMAELWTNFAKYGNPTPSPVKAPGNLPDTVWPKYNTSTYHYLYITEETIEPLQGYRSRNHAFWLDYMNYLSRLGLFPDDIPGSPMMTKAKGMDTEAFHDRISDFYTEFAMKAMEKSKMKMGKN